MIEMNLERAIMIATKAHAGQTDKGGNPYILHPLRVMLQMQCEQTRIVAVLHDVIEDSSWTFEDLKKEGFSDEVLKGLDGVTRRSGEQYDEFIERASQFWISRLVKLADLDDNCDIDRIPNPTHTDIKRIQKYKKAINQLLS